MITLFQKLRIKLPLFHNLVLVVKLVAEREHQKWLHCDCEANNCVLLDDTVCPSCSVACMLHMSRNRIKLSENYYTFSIASKSMQSCFFLHECILSRFFDFVVIKFISSIQFVWLQHCSARVTTVTKWVSENSGVEVLSSSEKSNPWKPRG